MMLRHPARPARGRLFRVTLATVAFAAVGSLAAASAAGGAGTDDAFRRVGTVRSNVVYEAAVARLSGQDASAFRGSQPSSVELALPPRAAYEDLVRRAAGTAGPVVLDFESLYLQGAPADAHRRFQKLLTLLSWAHQAVPGRVVGYYGVLGNTASSYTALERALAAHEDALFPGIYTVGDDFEAWQAGFRKVMAEAEVVAPGKPVYAYLWPSYHGGTKRSGTYPTSAPAHWRREIDEAAKQCAGVVVWGQSA